jgi:uncharacterized protein (DUF2236 family)
MRTDRSPRQGPAERPSLAELLGASLLVPPQGPGRPADPGLFGPGSVAWMVCRERVGIAGAQAILLLQIAHPLIAAGVDDHSTFRVDPLGRLRGTLQATLTALFGDSVQAKAVARQVDRTHERVRGTLPAAAPPYPAGTAYDARDQELGRWVHATLAWVLLSARELLVGRLDGEARARFHDEMKALGALFGVPEAAQPATFADFEAYLRDTVAGLTVTAEARALATLILDPPRPLLLAPAGPAARLLTAELLPERLRHAYGLPDGAAHRAARAALAAAVRTAVRTVPSRLRFWPHYLVACSRFTLAAPVRKNYA